MTLTEIASLIQTAAEVASFLGVPYASDVAAAAGIAPQVIADAQDALARIQGVFGGSTAVAPLEQKHIDALNTVQRQITSYRQEGRSAVSA